MKKWPIALFVLIVMGVAFLAYGSDLFWVVSNRNTGAVVENCTLYVDTGGVVYDTLVTNASGICSTVTLVDDVSYGYLFNLVGFMPETIRFFGDSIEGDETLGVEIHPAGTGEIDLLVYDLITGAGIPGVRVWADSGGKTVDTNYTDSNGETTFVYGFDSVFICFEFEETLGGYWPIDSVCIWTFPDSFHIKLLIPMDPLLGYTGILTFQNTYDGTRCTQTAVESCLCTLFTTGAAYITSGYTDSTGWLAVGDTFSAMSAGNSYDCRCHKGGDTLWTSTTTRKKYLGRSTIIAVEIDSFSSITSWPVMGYVTRFGKKLANAEVSIYMNDRGWGQSDGTYYHLIGAGQSVWSDAYRIYTNSNGAFKTFIADSSNIKIIIPTIGYNRSYLVTDTLNLGDVLVP